MLKGDKIAALLAKNSDNPLDSTDNPLVISPTPDTKKLETSGSASVDLRLGTWFVTLRQARLTHLAAEQTGAGTQLTKSHYINFGNEYLLHPKNFVLGVTLEWLRLPTNIAGYVTAKSSWGRYGLIIATATGIHPGFNGCLTLELTNVGELPIAIKPGMTICQLFLHRVEHSTSVFSDSSRFGGHRKPHLGRIVMDDVASKLSRAYKPQVSVPPSGP